ncbi:MAG TPA: hypothetical protein VK203_20755, partial [Nostocaceae cyanobacterium]|nr:hypothetical protein [Nostocaceae cyanobacterium]
CPHPDQVRLVPLGLFTFHLRLLQQGTGNRVETPLASGFVINFCTSFTPNVLYILCPEFPLLYPDKLAGKFKKAVNRNKGFLNFLY